jgi:predicted O-linked N-acetylglucosamine transferase (SPINDLY family)
MPPSRAGEATRLKEKFLLAQRLHQAGRLAEAQTIYEEMLRIRQRDADALHFLGLIGLQTGQAEKGVGLIERAIAIRPAYPQALGNLGIGYADLGRHKDALASFDKALRLMPGLAEVHDSRSNLLRELGQYEAAIASHDRAILLRPGDAGALNNRGNALRDLRRYQDALASYDRAISLQPGFVEAHCNRACVLQAMGRFEEALSGIDAVIARMPDHAEVHEVSGTVLRDLKRPAEALASFARAIALNPGAAGAHDGHGSALYDLGRYEEALASYGTAISLRPGFADAYYNRGNAFAAINRMQAALADYEQAAGLEPDHAFAWRGRGVALTALRQDREALASFRRAQQLTPDMPWLLGDIVFARRRVCDWTSDQAEIADLERRVLNGEKVASPFAVAAVSGCPLVQRKAAEIFAGSLFPALERPAAGGGGARGPKIRLAYISADFREHPMMHLMAGLLECHDKSRFELTAFSLGPGTDDACMQRIRPSFDRFIDAERLTDGAIAARARDLGIDIAIDLMGFTTGCRTGVFSRRAAPVQVNYLGYPGTMGSGFIDYIIADPVVIPVGAACHYAEQVVYMPGSYQVNDNRRPIDRSTPSRAEQGLPGDGFVFCCFNNGYKIAPDIFAGWMRILARVEGSVLWLFQTNEDAVANLRHVATLHGIAAERLVFAQTLPLAQHLARHRLADLFLDTLPYNAHTTASDALWAGLPVLTRIGESFAGRVAASLLHEAGLPELITATADAFEREAVALATHPGRLAAIRERLLANRLSVELFDTERFTRHLEAAYVATHARAVAGLPPAAIRVDALHER